MLAVSRESNESKQCLIQIHMEGFDSVISAEDIRSFEENLKICVFILKVNNATARVVTKKPQTPLVNSELVIITHIYVLF